MDIMGAPHRELLALQRQLLPQGQLRAKDLGLALQQLCSTSRLSDACMKALVMGLLQQCSSSTSPLEGVCGLP